ncbi:hypothetical protein KA005_11975 [bacterium]|nr:hypothetical protein [bacterium]
MRKRGKAKRLTQAQLEEMLTKMVDVWELVQSMHDQVSSFCSTSSRVSRKYQTFCSRMQEFKELLEWKLDEAKRTHTT